MDGYKSWLTSVTIWAQLLGFANMALTLKLSDGDITQASTAIAALVSAVLTVVGIWGRVRATTTLKKPV